MQPPSSANQLLPAVPGKNFDSLATLSDKWRMLDRLKLFPLILEFVFKKNTESARKDRAHSQNRVF
jgi:hypothetical protein